MIKHIVMWDIKEQYNGKNKNELIEELKNALESLKDRIPEIRSIEVGVNINSSEASCDVVLYSEFGSAADLQIYQKHPDHLKVAELVSNIRTSRHVVDYEV